MTNKLKVVHLSLPVGSLDGRNLRRSSFAAALSEQPPKIESRRDWQQDLAELAKKVRPLLANSNSRRAKSSIRQKGKNMMVRASRLSVNLSMIFGCCKAEKTP